MKKMFTMIITAVLLTANLSVGTVARAEDIECNHNFVEETTIVHHDAEYATKTIWAKLDWYTFTGENKIGDGTNQFDLGTSAGTAGWYHEDGRTMYCEDTIDTYDLVSYYYDYIDYLDYPDEAFLQRITIDNYTDYGMTYEEFCDQTDEYNFFGHLNPEFNPELDELVQFSWDVIGDGEYNYNNEFYYNSVTSLEDLFFGTDSSSKITGSYGMLYGFDENGAINPYWPILQYPILVADAYDEEVTQYVCGECGQFTEAPVNVYDAHNTAIASTTIDDSATTEPVVTTETETTETTTTTEVETTVETTTIETETTTTEVETETETTTTTAVTEVETETTETTTTTTTTTEPEFIRGDVNGDGFVGIADVIIFQRWLLGCDVDHLIPNWRAADLCEDDCLNVFDLCLLKRIIIYGEL